MLGGKRPFLLEFDMFPFICDDEKLWRGLETDHSDGGLHVAIAAEPRLICSFLPALLAGVGHFAIFRFHNQHTAIFYELFRHGYQCW